MKMTKLSFCLSAAFLSMLLADTCEAAPIVIDFEQPEGLFGTYSEADVTFSPASSAFNKTLQFVRLLNTTNTGLYSKGGAVGLNTQAVFDNPAIEVSVLISSLNSLNEVAFLRAYDINNLLLDETIRLVGRIGTSTVPRSLTVSGSEIVRVEFGQDNAGNNGTQVFALDFTYATAVPEPATFLLAGLGLLTFPARRRLT